MVFSSAVFLYWFLPAFLVVHALVPRAFRSAWIALASFVFYGWWRPDFTGLMLVSAVLDSVCARRIAAAQEGGRNGKGWLVLSLLGNLGLLGWFKYANFGVDTLNALLQESGASPVPWTRIVLPVGISFYTFQTMSYTIDVYRRMVPPQRNFADYLAFVTMFPQLVAGPIVRYASIAPQFAARDLTRLKFFQGVLAFQCGFAKKILLADPLGGLADQAFGATGLGAFDAWAGLLAYAFQIYFDFSGYSDMAIGLGLMIGFRFPVNFNAPYRAASITDFWRRWHISLSTWLRDYLYVPLGGNRKGRARTYVNLALVMILGGLWHGAAWTFVAWGAWHGLWLIVERAAGAQDPAGRTTRVFRSAATFAIVLAGWVFFRAADPGSAVAYFGSLAGAGGGAALLPFRPLHLAAFAAAAAVVWFLPTSQVLLRRCHAAWALSLQPLFLLALLHLDFQDHVPFLYYQF